MEESNVWRHATTQEYADFELRLEWRALRDRYNSGLYIRSSRKIGTNQINLDEVEVTPCDDS